MKKPQKEKEGFSQAKYLAESFLSLSELNDAIFEKLEEFNHKPFQKKDGSRALLFEEEKPFLQPLPPRPFELATWKVATVGPNYHIFVEKMNYSVPYEYIRQKVDVRVTRNNQWRLPVEESAKADTSAQYGFTRGADYYGGRDK